MRSDGKYCLGMEWVWFMAESDKGSGLPDKNMNTVENYRRLTGRELGILQGVMVAHEHSVKDAKGAFAELKNARISYGTQEGGFVFCTVQFEDHSTMTGVAKCNSRDEYDYTYGQVLALQRVVR